MSRICRRRLSRPASRNFFQDCSCSVSTTASVSLLPPSSVSSRVGAELREVDSTMKSARTWALKAVLGWYLISYCPSSTAHLEILPEKSAFRKRALSGCSVTTTMVKVWK
eukprot:TRINITY_DN13257_c0_g1_i15.p2 TRINITY_DN13257_c0_g1~~TRINITY_DN13257_c0_g1_i15.p2  ORF type:complete len:110 (-),score=4.63 TRINITY_DN13257_c0_g1_i15:319-648(-)